MIAGQLDMWVDFGGWSLQRDIGLDDNMFPCYLFQEHDVSQASCVNKILSVTSIHLPQTLMWTNISNFLATFQELASSY